MQIPRYERRQGITGEGTGVRVSQDIATAPARGLQQAGAAIGDVGDVLAARAERIREQDDLNYLVEVQNHFANDWRGFEAEEMAKTGKDTYGNVERGQEILDKAIENYTKDVKNPELTRIITQKLYSMTDGSLNHLARHQAGQRKAVTFSNIDGLLESQKAMAYQGNDLEELIGDYTANISALNLAGNLSDMEAEEIAVKGASELAGSWLEGEIDRDPDSAMEIIGSGALNGYLSAEQQNTYNDRAEKIKDAREKDFENIRLQAEKKAEEAENLRLEEINLDFTEKLIAETLTEEEVEKTLGTGPPESRTKRTSMTAQWKKAVAGLSKKEPETDNAVYTSLARKIYTSPESIKEVDIVDYIGKGLSRPDARALINELQSLKNDEKDTVRKQVAKEVLENFERDRKAGTFDPEGAEDIEEKDKTTRAGDIEHAKQVRDFLKWEKEHPDEDPIEYYEKIMTPYKENRVKGILERIPVIGGLFEPGEKELRDPARRREEMMQDDKEKQENKASAASKPKAPTKVEEKKPTVRAKIIRKADGTVVARDDNGREYPIELTGDGKVQFK